MTEQQMKRVGRKFIYSRQTGTNYKWYVLVCVISDCPGLFYLTFNLNFGSLTDWINWGVIVLASIEESTNLFRSSLNQGILSSQSVSQLHSRNTFVFKEERLVLIELTIWKQKGYNHWHALITKRPLKFRQEHYMVACVSFVILSNPKRRGNRGRGQSPTQSRKAIKPFHIKRIILNKNCKPCFLKERESIENSVWI